MNTAAVFSVSFFPYSLKSQAAIPLALKNQRRSTEGWLLHVVFRHRLHVLKSMQELAEISGAEFLSNMESIDCAKPIGYRMDIKKHLINGWIGEKINRCTSRLRQENRVWPVYMKKRLYNYMGNMKKM